MPVLENVRRWWPQVDKWCVQVGVSQSLAFAVIHQESGGDPNATRYEAAYEKKYILGNTERLAQCEKLNISTKDAATSYGLMQLMFFTGYGYGARKPADLLYPNSNIRYGVAHLGTLLKTYDEYKTLALAAYNGGHGGTKNKNGAAMKYAKKVMALYEEYRNAALTAKPVELKTVVISGNHFTQDELACKCGCIFRWPDPRLIYTLNAIRESINKKVLVNSGCRCAQHNAKVGGVTDTTREQLRGALGGPKDSNHSHGTAADIKCLGMTANNLWKHIREMWANGRLPYLAGLGKYSTFVHVDVDPVVSGRLREWNE